MDGPAIASVVLKMYVPQLMTWQADINIFNITIDPALF